MAKLFVYGTLKLGFSNHSHWMTGAPRISGSAAINGILLDGPGFPSLLDDKDEGICRVYGELYEVTEEHLNKLDILEGVSRGLYYRGDTMVVSKQYTGPCVAYYRKIAAGMTINRLRDGALCVPGGRWTMPKADPVTYADLKAHFRAIDKHAQPILPIPSTTVVSIAKPQTPEPSPVCVLPEPIIELGGHDILLAPYPAAEIAATPAVIATGGEP